MREDHQANYNEEPRPDKDASATDVARVGVFEHETGKWICSDESAFSIIPSCHRYDCASSKNAEPASNRKDDPVRTNQATPNGVIIRDLPLHAVNNWWYQARPPCLSGNNSVHSLSP